MKVKLSTISVALLTVLGSLTASVAVAAEAPSLGTRTDAGILWTEASLPVPAELLQIRIMAPARDGSRRVWQTCRFADVAPGTYTCGLDASAGSLAVKQRGTWSARLLLDGEPVARTIFQL